MDACEAGLTVQSNRANFRENDVRMIELGVKQTKLAAVKLYERHPEGIDLEALLKIRTLCDRLLTTVSATKVVGAEAHTAAIQRWVRRYRLFERRGPVNGSVVARRVVLLRRVFGQGWAIGGGRGRE